MIIWDIQKENQMLIILRYKKYIHVVPIIIDKNENIVIKTVYPSRKFNKLYKFKL